MNEDIEDKPLSKSPWDTNVALLGFRWIAFIPSGFILYFILNYLALKYFIWSTDNDGRMLIQNIFTRGSPIIPMIVVGSISYALSFLTAHICPKPKLGSAIFGIFYIFYTLNFFININAESNLSMAVVTFVVGGISVGAIMGLINTYRSIEF